MARLFNSALLLLIGGFCGWWLHDQLASVEAGKARDHQVDLRSLAGEAVTQPSNWSPVDQDLPTYSDDRPEPEEQAHRFQQLLEQRAYEQALDLYQSSARLSDEHLRLLRASIESHLKACLEYCAEGVFVSLAETWLENYYEDIPVLLLLAEHQRRQGYPEEAAKVLHMAMTYAYHPHQRDSVTLALRRLVGSTDAALGEQQRWIELAGFYELLETLAISEPEFLLRQAMVYRRLEEPERARTLLLELRAGDDEMDPQWTQNLDRYLAEMAPVSSAPTAPLTSVPITRRGEHYLVAATLNGQREVNLMIDTGASVTSLSRASFERMEDASFDFRGSRLFNTANGLAQGEVYRAGSLLLGRSRVDGIDVAILDFESPSGVDGLLGMNFLRNFRFEIDQDQGLLHLRPR